MKETMINVLCIIIIAIYLLILPVSIMENFLEDDGARKICVYVCLFGFIAMGILDVVGLILVMMRG